MGNLLSSLTTSAETMRTFERAISVSSNNVANANTPGFVRQQVNLVAQRLELDAGLPGGVRTGGLRSSRDAYLDAAARRQMQQSGGAGQMSALLHQIEPIFDISSGRGLAGAFDAFQAAVSQWTVGPNDYPARQNVIRAAEGVARAFQSTAGSLGAAAQGSEAEFTASTTAINRLGGVLAELNRQIRSDARALEDPGLDAQIHSTLDQLAEQTSFNMLRASDGTYSVYLAGETPLVLGEHVYPLSLDLSGSQPAIRDSEGRNITGDFRSGKIEALASFRNDFLPAIQADLDRLAGSFADQVNATLGAGVDANGNPPAQQLFTYSTNPGIASTLAVGPIGPSQLAAAAPTAPGGNANALSLAQLLTRRNVDNFTYSQFYGEVAGRVGRAISVAQQDEHTQAILLAQVQSVRDEKTKVSLDEEAANLVQFQRAYEANARLFQTLDELTQTLINLIR
jgi:flagellar hook-associated protein 1